MDDFYAFMAEEAKNLTVAATSPESVFDSVSNVTVIDRAVIERYNFASVSDALQTIAGVTVTRNYLMHNVPIFRGALQEHYADKVLVMIENVPMWNAVTGEGNLDRVGIDSVERIEVLRGPASVLYGSTALSGVVNIVLRRPRGQGTLSRLGGGVGSAAGGYPGEVSASRAGGLYARNGVRSSYVISADSREERQPAITFTDEALSRNSVREYLTSRNFSFAGRSGGGSCLFNASRGDQNYLGNTLTLSSGELFNAEREAALGSCTYGIEPPWGELKYTLTYDWQRRNIPRDAADDLRSDIVGSRLVNSVTARVPLPQEFYVEASADRQEIFARRYKNYYSHTGLPENDNGIGGRSNSENSVHLQAGYDHLPWKLAAGSRYTKDKSSGENLSSRVSAVYLLGDHSSVKAMFSQAFRAPTIFEQYFLSSPVTVIGNPALKPEKAETYELSFLSAYGSVFGHITVYRSRFEDSIFRKLGDFARDGVTYPGVNYYSNAPAYDSGGLELDVRYEDRLTHAFLALERIYGGRGDAHNVPAPGVFGLDGGSSWNFKYVPEYTVSGGASRDIGPFFAASNFNLLGPSRTLRSRLGTQFWADASVGYRKGAARHALAVRNVTCTEVKVPEYVRLRVVETIPMNTGRTLEYTFEYRF